MKKIEVEYLYGKKVEQEMSKTTNSDLMSLALADALYRDRGDGPSRFRNHWSQSDRNSANVYCVQYEISEIQLVANSSMFDMCAKTIVEKAKNEYLSAFDEKDPVNTWFEVLPHNNRAALTMRVYFERQEPHKVPEQFQFSWEHLGNLGLEDLAKAQSIQAEMDRLYSQIQDNQFSFGVSSKWKL